MTLGETAMNFLLSVLRKVECQEVITGYVSRQLLSVSRETHADITRKPIW